MQVNLIPKSKRIAQKLPTLDLSPSLSVTVELYCQQLQKLLTRGPKLLNRTTALLLHASSQPYITTLQLRGFLSFILLTLYYIHRLLLCQNADNFKGKTVLILACC